MRICFKFHFSVLVLVLVLVSALLVLTTRLPRMTLAWALACIMAVKNGLHLFIVLGALFLGCNFRRLYSTQVRFEFITPSIVFIAVLSK